MRKYPTRTIARWLIASLLPLTSYQVGPLTCSAQTQAPVASPQTSPPTSQQDSVKVFTEEILLPIVATDSSGRFDPTLEADDLLILEDGLPQVVRSVRRLPAYVLLLLDTAGASNPAMRTNATRDFAVRFVSLLNDEDHVAALQFGGKVEMIQKWTGDHEAAMLSLKTKLFSGRRTRLTEGLVAAGAALKDMPAGNRHVVLVTDGGESISEVADLQVAVNQLFASQATVHVIGLTLLGRKAINKLHPKYGVTITADKRKSAQDISDEIVRPRDPETLDTKLKRKIYLVIEKDLQMWRHSLKYAKTLKRNEQWLTWLAEQSGGEILLPGNADELPQLAGNLARQIDSQYLVTYTPKVEPRLETAQPLRSIEVVSRRVGLFVLSRRSQLGPVSAR